MGLLIGCATVPMVLVLLCLAVVLVVQEPLALVGLLLIGWAVRRLWRAHRSELQRRRQRP